MPRHCAAATVGRSTFDGETCWNMPPLETGGRKTAIPTKGGRISGEVVRLSEFLEEIPPQAAQLWKLNSDSAARLSRQEVYIRADRIAPAAQP